VLSRTLPWPLMTRETVMGDTPASRATSSMVTALLLRRIERLVCNAMSCG
jgi:hypothetical protein